jgi:hypothetical protein
MSTFGYHGFQPAFLDYWIFLTDWHNGTLALLFLGLGALAFALISRRARRAVKYPLPRHQSPAISDNEGEKIGLHSQPEMNEGLTFPAVPEQVARRSGAGYRQKGYSARVATFGTDVFHPCRWAFAVVCDGRLSFHEGLADALSLFWISAGCALGNSVRIDSSGSAALCSVRTPEARNSDRCLTCRGAWIGGLGCAGCRLPGLGFWFPRPGILRLCADIEKGCSCDRQDE